MTTSKLNVNEVIDQAKFTPFHWSILLWCLLIIIFDGYDLVIYGSCTAFADARVVVNSCTSGDVSKYSTMRNDVWSNVLWNFGRQNRP